MTMFDEIQKVQKDAQEYLDSLGPKFKQKNSGKSVVVFPYLKEHVVVDDPMKARDITSQPKYQKETSYLFNL